MVRFILHALAAALGFWVASRVVPGVHVDGRLALIEGGLLLGVLNALVRPILVLLTLPLTILTLGLFLLVVNGITVWLVTVFIHRIHIHGAWHTILTALVISITSWAASIVINAVTQRARA
ncbi:MAG TPA: phage holin family protein [Caulobacteraceae bacterium]|jgi:putative membrane protein|nr:phage holin family protein [Caulobacteraceae bacterium]